MSSLSFLKQIHKSGNEKKTKKKIEKELPFFISIVTLFATSGFGPYTIFQKMHDIKLLPTIRQESIKILKRVDVLGLDPLAAMMEGKMLQDHLVNFLRDMFHQFKQVEM